MRLSYASPLLAALVAQSTGCNGGPGRSDWAADTAGIHRIYRELPASVEAADAARYAAQLDDSITILAPGAAPVHGVPAVRSLLQSYFTAARFHVVLGPTRRLGVADSLAFVEYSGLFTTVPKSGGDSTTARNRYLDIVRRQPDGSWRLLVHSFQLDAPAVP